MGFTSQWILVGIEDLEGDFCEPDCDVRVAFWLADVDGPFLGVVVGYAFGTGGVAWWGEVVGFGADDCEDVRIGGFGGRES